MRIAEYKEKIKMRNKKFVLGLIVLGLICSAGGIGYTQILDIKLIQTLTEHGNRVVSVAFSPDGKYLALGDVDGTVKIWEMPGGKFIQTLTGHGEYVLSVLSVVFSPDGKYLASGGLERTIKIWEMPGGKLIQKLTGHNKWVISIVFSPDGKYLASGDFKTIKIWEMPGGKLIQTLTGHSEWVVSVAFSPDGKYLASGGLDNTIKIWEMPAQSSPYLPINAKIQDEGIVKETDLGQEFKAFDESAFDERINELVQQISSAMIEKKKITIAVIEFTDLNGNVNEFSKYLAEELITRLFQTDKFKVIERQYLNKVIEEQKLSLTRIIDPDSAKTLGKILGVEARGKNKGQEERIRVRL
jgi:TolB-like protein